MWQIYLLCSLMTIDPIEKSTNSFYKKMADSLNYWHDAYSKVVMDKKLINEVLDYTTHIKVIKDDNWNTLTVITDDEDVIE